MNLPAGNKLGPYQIVSPLGAGGMGEVYRARDTRLERTVAIKILPPQFSNDPVRKQRFEREAKTISSLNHPHICVLSAICYSVRCRATQRGHHASRQLASRAEKEMSLFALALIRDGI
jgi:serine/threonine protein kinase